MVTISIDNYRVRYQWIHLQNTQTPKVQGTLWKEGELWEPSKSEGFAVILCSLIIAEATHVKSNQYNHLSMSLAKRTATNIPKWKGKSHQASVYTKNYRQLSISVTKRGPSEGRAHQLVVQCQKSALKTHIQVYKRHYMD